MKEKDWSNYGIPADSQQPLEDSEEEEMELEESAAKEKKKKDPKPGKPKGQTATREELLDALQTVLGLIRGMEQGEADLESRVAKVDSAVQDLMQKEQHQSLMRELGEAYKENPFDTTVMLVEQAKQELAELVEMRIHEALVNERTFARLVDDLLDEPENADVRPYRDELDFLITEKGLPPDEALELIRSLERRRSGMVDKRTVAAREIRNRSVLESGGEVSDSGDDDKELDRVLKKSKSLDEMFAGLRKLKL
ncbi:hypothetical protein ACFL2Q_18260 [Thermodesulfobacteriota bacterium]